MSLLQEGTAFFPGSKLAGNGLLVSDGALWQRQRQLSNPAFRKAAVDSYLKVSDTLLYLLTAPIAMVPLLMFPRSKLLEHVLTVSSGNSPGLCNINAGVEGMGCMAGNDSGSRGLGGQGVGWGLLQGSVCRL